MSNQTRIIKDQSSLGQFSSAIAQICEEKGIDKEMVLSSIEAALAAAYKKEYGKKGQIILAKLDEKTSETRFKQLKEVVDKSNRVIDEEYLSDEARQLPENAVKSNEIIERHQVNPNKVDDNEEEVHLPRFNPERDVLIEDAQKIIPDIQVGDFVEFSLETKDEYGRIASQTAKQVIIQKIREAERETMYEEFKGKEGEIVNGVVQRVENGKVFVDLGKSVGILFPSEQIPGEEYRIGQRLKLYIESVNHDSRSLGIRLSRKHPQLLVKLFELEVPEIFSGTIEIKAVAREAGSRSKIAVISHESDIDPIGSCVGQKGTRVQAVIDELNGEKIDIIEWVDNSEVMIAQALSPAKIVKVDLLEEGYATNVGEMIVDNNDNDVKNDIKKDGEDKNENKDSDVDDKNKDSEQKKAIAYVTEDQLSLAIGKRGQNVRLAVKLTGWTINIEVIKDETGDKKNEENNNEQIGSVTQDKSEVVKDETGDKKNDENYNKQEDAFDNSVNVENDSVSKENKETNDNSENKKVIS